MDCSHILWAQGALPVVRPRDLKDGLAALAALREAGLLAAEIRMETLQDTYRLIRTAAEQLPSLAVGAGGLNGESRELFEAGAAFTYCAGTDQEELLYPNPHAHPLRILSNPPAPPCTSPHSIIWKAAPETLQNYLPAEETLCCIVEVPCSGDSKSIADFARSLLGRIFDFSLAHIGLNLENSSPEDTARQLGQLFGLPLLPGEPSVFAGSLFECMRTPYLGHHGHIAIRTRDFDRACAFLALHGVAFNPATRKTENGGHRKTIYFQEEIGGFAFHLLQTDET